MPKGRMLAKKISFDEGVAKLSIEAALLYTWCIPHLDIEGRLYGEPDILKGMVVPYVKELTVAKITACIKEMVAAGLIEHYGNGKMYIEFKGFKNNQTLNPERESKSNIPAPEQFRSNSGVTPAKYNIIKYNIRDLGEFKTLNLDLTELQKEFNHFEDMRKKIRKPLTDRAAELIISKLFKLSGKDIKKAILILQQSITNSWQGVFELKQSAGTKSIGSKYDNM